MKEKIKNLYSILSFKEKSNVIKLTKLSIIMLIILDIFVSYTIVTGISYQSKIIDNPNLIYSQNCINNIKHINYSNNYLSLKNYNNHQYQKYVKEDSSTNSICKEINNKILKIKESGIVYESLDKYEQTHKVIYNNREKIEDEKNKIKVNFENHILIKDLISYINNNKNLLLVYENEIQKYKLKTTIIEIIFTIPLIVIFFILMNKYNNNGNYVKYIINKNLLIVSSIPLVLNIIILIYNLIPQVLLKKIINILYNINLPIIVYYLITLILIVVITFLIIKVQNKRKTNIENNKKINFIEFYNKNICANCNNKVNYIEMNYCPNCLNQLSSNCLNCEKKIIIGTKGCYNCGK